MIEQTQPELEKCLLSFRRIEGNQGTRRLEIDMFEPSELSHNGLFHLVEFPEDNVDFIVRRCFRNVAILIEIDSVDSFYGIHEVDHTAKSIPLDLRR